MGAQTGGEGARGEGLSGQADVHRCKTDTRLDRRMRALLSGDEIMVLETKNAQVKASVALERFVSLRKGFHHPVFMSSL